MNDFFNSLVKIAYIEKQKRIEREKEKAIREKKRELIQKRIDRIEREKENTEQLQKDATLWEKSKDLRQHIKAVEEKYVDFQNPHHNGKPLKDWIAWANRIADGMDPLAQGVRFDIKVNENYEKMLRNIW